MSSSQLRTIPRLPLPPLSKKAAKLFRTSPAEIELVTRLRAKIEPRRTVAMSALRGADAKLGIKLDEVGPVRDAGSKDSRGASDEEQLNESEEEISQV